MRTATFIALVLVGAAGPAAAADPVQGQWLAPQGGAKIRIGPCPTDRQQMCGAVSWIRDAAVAKATDTKNLVPALRSRPIMGLPVLWGFRRAAPGKWTGGKVYSMGNGSTYGGVLTVQKDGSLKLEACVVKMVCTVQIWRRA